MRRERDCEIGIAGLQPARLRVGGQLFSVLKLLGPMIFDLIRKRNGNGKD